MLPPASRVSPCCAHARSHTDTRAHTRAHTNARALSDARTYIADDNDGDDGPVPVVVVQASKGPCECPPTVFPDGTQMDGWERQEALGMTDVRALLEESKEGTR